MTQRSGNRVCATIEARVFSMNALSLRAGVIRTYFMEDRGLMTEDSDAPAPLNAVKSPVTSV